MNIFSKMWCKIFGCAEFIALQAEVGQMKTDVGAVQTDVGGVKTDVGAVQSGVTDVKTEQAGFKIDLTKIKEDMATMAIILTGIAGQFPIVVPAPIVDMGTMPRDLEVLTLPDMSIWFQSADYADNGEVHEIEVWAKGTAGASMSAFGLSSGFLFVPEHFTYTSIERGADTIGWNSLDANLISPGIVSIGGFAGGARGVVGDKPAHLFTIKLTVSTDVVTDSEIMATNFVDDFADMLPQPISFIVALNGN